MTKRLKPDQDSSFPANPNWLKISQWCKVSRYLSNYRLESLTNSRKWCGNGFFLAECHLVRPQVRLFLSLALLVSNGNGDFAVVAKRCVG